MRGYLQLMVMVVMVCMMTRRGRDGLLCHVVSA